MAEQVLKTGALHHINHWGCNTLFAASLCPAIAPFSASPEPLDLWGVYRLTDKEIPMRGVLLWLIGIPIPIIILLFLFNVL
jgi:hypothetical protein